MKACRRFTRHRRGEEGEVGTALGGPDFSFSTWNVSGLLASGGFKVATEPSRGLRDQNSSQPGEPFTKCSENTRIHEGEGENHERERDRRQYLGEAWIQALHADSSDLKAGE